MNREMGNSCENGRGAPADVYFSSSLYCKALKKKKFNSLFVRSEILGQNSVHIEMFNVLSIQYCLSKDPFKSIPKNCVVEFLLYQQWIK